MSAPQVPATGVPADLADTTSSPPGSARRDGRTPRSSRFRRLASVTAATLLAAAVAPLMPLTAQAATAGMGAVDPQNGFPTWFSDGVNKLQLCYMAGAGCLSEPPN